jgi:hypothetical protein
MPRGSPTLRREGDDPIFAATVYWADGHAPATTDPPGRWIYVKCWVEGVMQMHREKVRRIVIDRVE